MISLYSGLVPESALTLRILDGGLDFEFGANARNSNTNN